MDIVLGVSIDPGAVRLVLVEGAGDGATIDHETLSPSADIVSAVLGTQALSSAGGNRLTAIGITSTGNVHALADELAAALDALGFVNVAVVGEQQATEALAQGLNAVAATEATAVLSVEPDSATLAIVEVDDDGAVVKSVTRTLDGIDPGDGVTKLAAALDDPNSSADNLFVVSARVDVDDVKAYLDDALPMPVHAPADPELALARGAALAVAAGIGSESLDGGSPEAARPTLFVPPAVRATAAAETAVTVVETPDPPRPLDRLRSVTALSSVLGVSAVTFVVAVAVAVGMYSGDEPTMTQPDPEPTPVAAPVQQQAAPVVEQAPVLPPPQLPPAPIVAPPAPAAPPLPPQVIAAINRLQQPVTIPAVPGVSDAIPFRRCPAWCSGSGPDNRPMSHFSHLSDRTGMVVRTKGQRTSCRLGRSRASSPREVT